MFNEALVGEWADDKVVLIRKCREIPVSEVKQVGRGVQC